MQSLVLGAAGQGRQEKSKLWRLSSEAIAFWSEASQWREMEESCYANVCLSVCLAGRQLLGAVNWFQSLLFRSCETAACIPVGNFSNSSWAASHSETCCWESTCYTALASLLKKTYTAHAAKHWCMAYARAVFLCPAPNLTVFLDHVASPHE